jgi:hypothetical protein
MKLKLTRKRAIASAAVTASMAMTGGAIAYFTAGGTGTGNTQVGTGSGLQLTATITPGTGGLVPGGNPADVAFSVTNPGTSNQLLATVSLASVLAYSDAAHTNNITGTTAGHCDTSQFTMSTVTENQTIGSGATVSLPNDGTLVFNDPGANQDGCKNAYLVASFTSS